MQVINHQNETQCHFEINHSDEIDETFLQFIENAIEVYSSRSEGIFSSTMTEGVLKSKRYQEINTHIPKEYDVTIAALGQTKSDNVRSDQSHTLEILKLLRKRIELEMKLQSKTVHLSRSEDIPLIEVPLQDHSNHDNDKDSNTNEYPVSSIIGDMYNGEESVSSNSKRADEPHAYAASQSVLHSQILAKLLHIKAPQYSHSVDNNTHVDGSNASETITLQTPETQLEVT